MLCSHCMRTGPGPDRYRDQMESVVSYRNAHTGPRQGHWQGPIVPIVPVSFSVLVPSPVPLQCEYVITCRLSGSKVVAERKALNITFYAYVGDNY